MITNSDIKNIVEQHLKDSDAFIVEIKVSLFKIAVIIDKPSGITIEECSALNRYLQNQLANSGELETHELEVGSPGMDQPLKVPQQYLRRIGREMNVITVDGRNHSGKLVSADESQIEIIEVIIEKVNKKKITREEKSTLTFNQIKEAKLIFNFKTQIKN